MFQFITLTLVGIICSLMCYISFDKSLHNKWWYIPLALLLGLTSNSIWILTTKYFEDEKKLYAFSLIWDVLFVAIYYFLPLIFFDIKLGKNGYVGLILMIIGLLIIKIKI